MDANTPSALNPCIGLWIDDERAVIIFSTRAGEETQLIVSGAHRQPGRIAGKRSAASNAGASGPAGEGMDEKAAADLNRYYDEVISCIHHAGSLLIFGPDEAKSGLAKRLSHQEPTVRSVNVEQADRMTYRQIAAKVREHFRDESPVIVLR